MVRYGLNLSIQPACELVSFASSFGPKLLYESIPKIFSLVHLVQFIFPRRSYTLVKSHDCDYMEGLP